MEKTTTVPGGKPPPPWIPDRTSFSGISAGKERYANPVASAGLLGLHEWPVQVARQQPQRVLA